MTLSTLDTNASLFNAAYFNEAKIQEIKQAKPYENEIKDEDLNEASFLPNNLLLLDQNLLKDEDFLKKNILENILGSFGLSSESMVLIPADAFNFSIQTQSSNQYAQYMQNTQNGLVYGASQEYYEKTNIEFSGKATIQTPSGTYEIEINFEYTQEFYQKNTQEISYMQENLHKPIVLNTNQFDDAFKNLKEISLLFDILREESEEKNRDLFHYLKDLLTVNNIENNKDDKKIDNFEVLQKNESSQYSLMAVQKEGIGIFVENFESQKSSLSYKQDKNSQSIEASYSSQSISYSSISREILA